MVDSYMNDMDKLLAVVEEELINEQLKEAINFGKDKGTNNDEEEEEISETKMLWREMDDAMTKVFLQEQIEVCHLISFLFIQ